MKYKVFIDGSEGTTGLSIHGRLVGRPDIELLVIDPALRKDREERRKLLNAADISFLCLPDEAAKEAVSLIDNPKARVIDPSTAHRTAPGWVYGLPELSPKKKEQIKRAARVANPGCHATGFIACVYPLLAAGILSADVFLCCHSVTGYSGGGKKMIAEYTSGPLPAGYESARQYGLSEKHKHQPEMQAVCGLLSAPVFNPIVSNFYAGMVTTVPYHNKTLAGNPTAKDVHEIFAAHYKDAALVRVMPFGGENLSPQGFLDASALAGKDGLEIYVFGHEEQTVVAARFDNLGKGAGGAAVQNMNLMLGLPEDAGLSAW